MDIKPGALGMEGLGDLSVGTHFCLFYETEQDLLETLALYFNTGLVNNEFCLWITPESFEKARNALRKVIPSADQYLEAGQIEILSCQQWYCVDDIFDAARTIQAFDAKLSQALEKGYPRIRVLGDEAWLSQEHWKPFSDYEANLDTQFGNKPLSIVCAYPAGAHNAADILDIARTHRFIAAKRNGKWEILESPELKHVKEELEAKVQERTAHLSRANQVLQAEIIERRQAQEALTESQVRLQVALQAAQIGTGEWDLEADQVSLSEGLRRIYGFAPGTLTTGFAEFAARVHPEDRERFRSKLAEALASETDFGLDYRVVWPDASVHWVTGRAHIHRDELSKPTRMVGASMDITERKQAEAELQKNKEILQMVFDNVPAMITMVDKDGRFILTNREFESRLGWRLDELTEQSPDMLAELYPAPQARQAVLDFAERADGRWEDFRTKTKDGRVIDTSWAMVRLSDGTIIGVGKDITDRKQAEERLQSETHLTEQIMNSLPGVFYVLDEQGRFQRWNQNFERVTGYSSEEVAQISPLDLFTGEDQKKIEQCLRNVFEQGMSTVEANFVAKDGTRTPYYFIGRQGRLDGQVFDFGMGIDISERKRAEEALRKSERVLREAESLGHTGSWEQDLVTGEIFNTDENFHLFFGDDRSKGANLEDYAQVVHPDDREYVLQRRAELLEEEGPGDIEYRVVWPDGSVHVIFGRATVVRNEAGQPIRVYGTNVDITERKQVEERLRQAEEQARKALDTIPAQIASGPPDGSLEYCNQQWLAYAGLTLEELQRGTWQDLLHPDDKESVLKAWRESIETGKPYEQEERHRRFDGVYRWFLARGVPLMDAEGRIERWYGTLTDIDDRKRAEEEMHRQTARAETLARIASRLNKQLDLDAVIHAICQEAVDTFQVSQATISLYDAKRDLLDYAGGVNIPPEYAAKFEPISRVQFDELVRTMGPILVVPDIQALPNVPNVEFSVQLDVRTVVTADLRRDQELIGVLVLGVNGQVREFDQDELSLLKAISDQAAQAIANAQLLRTANDQRQQLRDLSAKLMEVQEAERRALTAELHDRVGQNLTGLSINLQNMKASLSPEAAQALATKFDDAQVLVEDTSRQIRDIMAELHLPELEDYGLAAALETYAERAASRGNLELIADLPDLDPPRLPSSVRATVFRAAQEAISNVLKHANATQLEVSLKGQNGRVRLKVEDNGQGFEPDLVAQKEGQTWGLQIMRERIESIGGKVKIESRPGQGTRVIFDIERPS